MQLSSALIALTLTVVAIATPMKRDAVTDSLTALEAAVSALSTDASTLAGDPTSILDGLVSY